MSGDGDAALTGAAPPEAAAGRVRAREVAGRIAASNPDSTRSLTLVWQDPLASAAEGAGLSGLEYMRAIAAGEIAPAPIAVLLDMGPVELAEGAVTFAGRVKSTTTRSASSTAGTPRPCWTRLSAAPCTRRCRPA